jgi:hypothetical protein
VVGLRITAHDGRMHYVAVAVLLVLLGAGCEPV